MLVLSILEYASEMDNFKTRINIISIIIIRTRNNLIFRRLGLCWFISKTSCGHSVGCATGGDVTSIDQALTTSDPDNDAGPSSRSIKSSSEPSAGGETAPHPANKDKSFEKKPEFGVGRVSSFSGSWKVSYDLMMVESEHE